MKKAIIILILAVMAIAPVMAEASAGVGISFVGGIIYPEITTRFDTEGRFFANVNAGYIKDSSHKHIIAVGGDIGVKAVDTVFDLGFGAKYELLYFAQVAGTVLHFTHILTPFMELAVGCPEVTLFLDVAPTMYIQGNVYDFVPYPTASFCVVWGF